MIETSFEAMAKGARKRPLWTPLPKNGRETAYGRKEIERILPHRGPALLLDSIDAIDLSEGCLRGTHRVAKDDPAFDGHFPGEPIYPGALQLELIGQAGVCLLHFWAASSCDLALDGQPRRVRPVRIHRADFVAEVLPGDSLTVLAKVIISDDFTSICAGQILTADGVCAFGILEVYFV
jgi:3-hydroxymyristoyl/3-hydroxydecanoyl-(acyl carrier protein) dehydratase